MAAEDSRFRRESMILPGLAAVIVAAVLLLALLPRPNQQKYPDRIPVRFWHPWTGQWRDVIERHCRRFNESQDKYEVMPLSVPGSTDSKFLLAVAGGDPPDCMSWPNFYVPKFADSGLLQPLDEVMSSQDLTKFVASIRPLGLKVGTYNGRLYGACGFVDTFAIYYRVDHLRAAGLDPNSLPQTLEELVEWGDKLNRFDRKGNLIRLGFLPAGLLWYSPVFGNGFYDWSAQKVTVNTPDNLRCLSFIKNQWDRVGRKNVETFESGLNTGQGGLQFPFITGSYSIVRDGQWRVEQLAEYAPDLEYVTAPVPPPAHGRKFATWCPANVIIIPKGSKHAAGAWEFIKYWIGMEDPEATAAFYVEGGWPPMFPAVSETPTYMKYVEDHPQFKVFLDMVASENAVPSPPVPFQSYFMDQMARVEDRVVRGRLTPKQGLMELEKVVQSEETKRKDHRRDDKP